MMVMIKMVVVGEDEGDAAEAVVVTRWRWMRGGWYGGEDGDVAVVVMVAGAWISMDLRMDRSSPDTYNSYMVFSVHQRVYTANLKYSDKHNMVAFLKKPNESFGFTEVVDFLKGTSL
ncbi:hypothetical protein Tco_1382765, partial [Tanacetum coccineum]